MTADSVDNPIYLGDVIGELFSKLEAAPTGPYWIRVWEDSDRPLGLKEIMYGGKMVLVDDSS